MNIPARWLPLMLAVILVTGCADSGPNSLHGTYRLNVQKSEQRLRGVVERLSEETGKIVPEDELEKIFASLFADDDEMIEFTFLPDGNATVAFEGESRNATWKRRESMLVLYLVDDTGSDSLSFLIDGQDLVLEIDMSGSFGPFNMSVESPPFMVYSR